MTCSLRVPFLAALLLAAACGASHSAVESAASEVAASEAPSMRPATDYFSPQTVAMGRFDVAALRALPGYASVWPALAAGTGEAERDVLEQLRALVEATDTLWVGAAVPHRTDSLRAVVVGRGHYDDALIAGLVAALESLGGREVGAGRAGRPFLRLPHGFAATPDDQTVVFTLGMGEGRLRALVDGASRPIGLLDGLLRLGEESGFGGHAVEVLGLPAGHLAGELERGILGRRAPEGSTLDAIGLWADLDSGLEGELRVDVDSAGSAERLARHMGQELEAARAAATALPGLEPFARHLTLGAHGSRVTVRASMNSEELMPALAFLGQVLTAMDRGASLDAATTDSAVLRGDIELFCTEATTIAQQMDLSSTEAVDRLNDRVLPQLQSRAVREAFVALVLATPENRYEIFRETVIDLGVPDVSCPGFEATVRAAP